MPTVTPAYWLPDVVASDAKEHPAFARLLYAGPWAFKTHPNGGTIAAWRDFPAVGEHASLNPSDYCDPQDCGDGLRYLQPQAMPEIYALVVGNRAGVDVTLACGVTLTIPPALSSHRALRLSGRQRDLPPIGEFGRLAFELLDAARSTDTGIPFEDPRLQRVICLAIGARYRSTPELLEDLNLVAAEDADPILSAVWFGDPKALERAAVAARSSSPSSASPTAP